MTDEPIEASSDEPAPSTAEPTEATADEAAPWMAETVDAEPVEAESTLTDEPTEGTTDEAAEASADELAPWMAELVAATAAERANDPDDAFAPVLNDVDQQPRTGWVVWSAAADEAAEHDAGELVTPEPVLGKVVGPTPPDDLFAEAVSEEPAAEEDQTQHAIPPDTHAANQGPVPSETEIAEITALVPTLFSTSPNMPQQPLVVRIEVALVDDSRRLRPVDAARRVGPWNDEDGDDSLTPRHPEFEPRTHLGQVVDQDSGMQPPSQQPQNFQQATPPPPWTAPQPADTWKLNNPPADPVTPPPAATLAPAPPLAAPPARTYEAPPVFEPAPAAPAPVGAAAVATSSSAVSGATGDQSDLWFLASEPEEGTADAAPAAEAVATVPPSTMVTAGLTVGMALVVIILVLVFIQLMTALLH